MHFHHHYKRVLHHAILLLHFHESCATKRMLMDSSSCVTFSCCCNMALRSLGHVVFNTAQEKEKAEAFAMVKRAKAANLAKAGRLSQATDKSEEQVTTMVANFIIRSSGVCL
jgi:hypothetical protein